MTAPLLGVRVVDLSQNLPGPYCTHVLAALGAEVWKVEPVKGEPGRFIEPFFTLLNRGKRGVTLDLRTEAGVATLLQMVRGADVLVEGFRPGVLERLGVGPDVLRAVNPRLVICRISAFGQAGPRAAEPGHDLNLQALSGLSHLERDASGRPVALVLPVADLSAALAAVASITTALFARERDGSTGDGGVLDVGMLDALLGWTALWSVGVDLGAPVRAGLAGRFGVAGAPIRASVRRILLDRLARRRLYVLPHYGLFRCADGAWVALGVVDEAHFWRATCEVLGLGRLAGLKLPARVALGPALRPLVAARLRRLTASQAVTRLSERGVPITPVPAAAAALDDPQVIARDLARGPGMVRAPVAGAAHIEGGAPRLGQDNDAIEPIFGAVSDRS